MTTPHTAAIGLDLTLCKHRRLYVLRRVRAGAEVRRAAAEAGVTLGAVQMWRLRVPGFAKQLDEAKRSARSAALASDPRKPLVLALVDRGLSFKAAARRLGMPFHALSEWAKCDRSFAIEYRRRLGPTGRGSMHRRIPALLAALKQGASIPAACQAAGLDSTGVYRWQRIKPELWRQVEEARAAGGGARREVRR